MIKKNKKRLLYIAISVIALIIVGMLTNNVLAEIYNPSESEFLSTRADDLVGKNISWTFYDTLKNKGNLACFFHREGGSQSDVNHVIHSVFDISFDNTKGEMKVYSVMNNGVSGTVSKTTYASDYVKDKNGNVIKNGRAIGTLAANTARGQNAYTVWEVLKLNIKNKAVVNESAIVGGINSWGGNENYGGAPNTSQLTNPADGDTVSDYQKYRKIKQITLKDKNNNVKNAKETGREIKINNKSYTVIGPFKMSFAKKGITEVNVASATWTSSKKGEIYWKTSKDIIASNSWTTGWSGDFNQKVEKGSEKYYISNKAFYLAVETSKLPSSGKYKVSIKQDKFTYYNSRIAVTVGAYAQQIGLYCYDNTPKTVEGTVEWNLTRNSLKTLVINKKDSTTKKALTGASFKIYAVLKDGTKGWVSGSAAGTKTYGKNATEYAAKVNIKNLKVGTYYIYEVKAPNGYSLANQEGYHKAATGSSSLSGDWVYVGNRTLKNSSTTVKVAATNIATPKLKITKKDSKKDTNLTETRFKIYAVLKDGTKGWVSGSANGAKTFGKNADEYAPKVNIEQLKFGTYYIYETKAQDGYDLKEQEGYHKKAEGSDSLTGDWVYLGSQKVDADSMPKGHVFEFKATNKKEVVANLKIIKKDNKTDVDLSGAKFKIYGVLDNGTKGWVSGSVNERKTIGNNADEYDTNVNIEKLKLGTYYIYETKTPEGYDITKQDGYHQKAEGSDGLSGDWVYVGAQKVVENGIPENEIIEVKITNKKVVSELEGDVWVDEPDTKANATDNIYTNNSKDYLKEGITVNLYSGNGTQLATTKTDSNGHYKFTTKNASSYTDADKAIYYWDLADAYVEFNYNNKTTYNEDGSVKEYGYVVVDPFVGTDVKVNSKAQEETITTDMLDDNKLTGIGKAITNKDAKITDANQLLKKNDEIFNQIKDNKASESTLKDVPLACYYDKTTFKVSNINLGLREKTDGDHAVNETLAYVKVNMNGYTYTYRYGEKPAVDSPYVPAVKYQTPTKSFTKTKVYPTDVSYNAQNHGALKVYVVYRIDVKNNKPTYLDSVYYEQRLYLDSLVNNYDTSRYELCNNENNSDQSDFALWTNVKDGQAKYDVNNDKSVYKNGISAKDETISSWIQFKIKDEALDRILKDSLTTEEIENTPTQAEAIGYHEYLRTDNAWKHNDSVRAYEGAKGTNTYPTQNDAKKKYYVHKTISKVRTSGDNYIKLSLGETRKVSGIVFEDTKKDNDSLGNGILDGNENNRAQNVTVSLLNTDKSIAKLYDKYGNTKEATLETEVGGTYTFDGVVPGYYYIRFTYGDGTQKLVPAGTDIKSNDYKSTIINTEANGAGDTIKNAMSVKADNLVSPTDKNYNAKLVEWYKYLNSNNYSTAVDDLAEREKVDEYTYTDDGKVYDKDGKEAQGLLNVNAYTPITSISIENDTNTETTIQGEDYTQKSSYSGFNFGLITTPTIKITPQKKITNVKLTTQTGTTLVSANPTDKSAAYITALDEVTGGSKYAKMELDKSLMYGSSLETTYEITIENNSDKDYVEEDKDSSEYGNYYYYGEKTSTTTKTRLKTVKVEEVVDELDSKYNFDSNESTFTAYVSSPDKGETQKEVKVTKNNSDGSSQTTNTISITGWEKLASGESEHMSYTVTSLLSENNDTAYENKVKITKVSLDRLSTLQSNYEWRKDETTLTITPPTGGDRRPIYWVAGTLGLIVLAGGIIFIKKKLLKK